MPAAAARRRIPRVAIGVDSSSTPQCGQTAPLGQKLRFEPFADFGHPRPHRHASDERSLNMSILKSLFQMGLSVLRTALRVAAEIALTRIIELAIAAA
jgi:hypothetical protein